jgi:mono/diheme cytochrome c family protein
MKALFKLTVLLCLWLASSQAWSLESGQRLYQRHCAGCHGITGIPVTPQTPNLSMREGMNKPDIMLVQGLKTGGRGAMPPFFGILSDQELMEVIRYVRVMR